MRPEGLALVRGRVPGVPAPVVRYLREASPPSSTRGNSIAMMKATARVRRKGGGGWAVSRAFSQRLYSLTLKWTEQRRARRATPSARNALAAWIRAVAVLGYK